MYTVTDSFDEINIEINIDDIDSALDTIDKIEKIIRPAIQIGLERSKEKIIKKLQSNLQKYGLLKELGDGIRVEIINDGFEITVTKISKTNGVNYALFYEYGTGLAGQNSPHPESFGYGDMLGWWYPTISSDPNPTKRIFKDGVLRAFTRSRPSAPFMYDTYLWIKSYSPIKREINKAIKELLK